MQKVLYSGEQTQAAFNALMKLQPFEVFEKAFFDGIQKEYAAKGLVELLPASNELRIHAQAYLDAKKEKKERKTLIEREIYALNRDMKRKIFELEQKMHCNPASRAVIQPGLEKAINPNSKQQ